LTEWQQIQIRSSNPEPRGLSQTSGTRKIWRWPRGSVRWHRTLS